MEHDNPQLSLVSQGANFDVLHGGERIGAIQYGLHVGDYAIVIQSKDVIYCYSVSKNASAVLNPSVVLDQLLNAFKSKKIPYRILFEGVVKCIQYGAYLTLCVEETALMWLSLHPIENYPGCFAFSSTDREINHEYYVFPVDTQLSQPELNISVLHHSMGWCHRLYGPANYVMTTSG